MNSAPTWLAAPLAVVMVAVAVYCVGRLAVGRRWRRAIEYDVDLVHVGMGVAMAGMLLPHANPIAGHGWNVFWTIFFALTMCWFGTRSLAAILDSRPVGHHLVHLLAGGAMLYMLDGMPHGAGMAMAGMGTGSSLVPTALTVILVAVSFGHAAVAANRVARPVAVTAGSTGTVALAPRLAGSCQVAMSLTAGYMLLLML